MPEQTPTSGVPNPGEPVYVVFGSRQDAVAFRDRRHLPVADVMPATLSPTALRALNRRVILVDAEHGVIHPHQMELILSTAGAINRSLGLTTERIAAQ